MAEQGIVAVERSPLGHINLRGNVSDSAFAAAVAQALGAELPIAPNTVVVAPKARTYWLGPDEWLLVTPARDEAALAGALRQALAGVHCAITEVSGGQVVIELQGAQARALLAKECPLDLEGPELVPGRCAQTRLAKAGVLLRPLEGGAMELIVRRSFADYLWTWLEDAAIEYGFARRAEPRS